MAGFIYFLISFLIVIGSSYFLTNIFKISKLNIFIIICTLITCSQLIISVETLSFFKAVEPFNLLGINFATFVISLTIWLLTGRQSPDLSVMSATISRITSSLKKDKFLLVLCCFFILSTLITLFLALFAPANQPDSLIYYLARIGFWIQHKSLDHFDTSSIRQIVFPVNSEIFIMWPMLFTNKDYLAGLTQFLAYLGNLFLLYNFLSYLKVSTKRTLWTLLITASLPGLIVQASGIQGHLALGFFLFSSLYLYLMGVTGKDSKLISFSAVAFALALGIKSSVFYFIPAYALVFSIISIRETKQLFFKPLMIFSLSLIPAFLILGSFNYFLNYQSFGNPFGLYSYVLEQTTQNPTLKAFLANVIRYIYSFIDFTGIKAAQFLSFPFLIIRTSLFSFAGVHDSDGLMGKDNLLINTHIYENFSLFGPIGFLVFLPLAIRYGLTKPFAHSHKAYILSLTGLITVIFIFTISIFRGYEIWNNRFLITAIIIASPILAFSYSRKSTFYKVLITLIAIYTYLVTPLFNELKPVFPINGKSVLFSSRDELRYCLTPYGTSVYNMIEYAKDNIPDYSKIGIIFSHDHFYYEFFDKNPTWKIYPLKYYKFIRIRNYNEFNYLVILSEKQIIYAPNKSRSIYEDDNMDFKKIPPNYKLIKTIIGKNTKGESKWKYYIYKNQD